MKAKSNPTTATGASLLSGRATTANIKLIPNSMKAKYRVRLWNIGESSSLLTMPLPWDCGSVFRPARSVIIRTFVTSRVHGNERG
jgi:hypothetical protein